MQSSKPKPPYVKIFSATSSYKTRSKVHLLNLSGLIISSVMTFAVFLSTKRDAVFSWCRDIRMKGYRSAMVAGIIYLHLAIVIEGNALTRFC